MPNQLYVFETILPNGIRVSGSAGLPYDDMNNLKTYYDSAVTRIIPMNEKSDRLKIVTPLSPKS